MGGLGILHRARWNERCRRTRGASKPTRRSARKCYTYLLTVTVNTFYSILLAESCTLALKQLNSVGIPIIVFGALTANLYDSAYGTKQARITKEAEYILEHERHRFVPVVQAPQYYHYTKEERVMHEKHTKVRTSVVRPSSHTSPYFTYIHHT